ncbi:MAG: hypothetical protein U1E27_04165, partial [Kiritimatiellia bacterium]|nr:hypothetical protein [Kiritimatiellia bacterium]
MPDASQIETALTRFRRAMDAGRVAHAWILIGPPRGAGLVLAEAMLRQLFCVNSPLPCGECAGCRRVQEHAHPDIVWIEPESVSRQLKIDQIRTGVIAPLSQTAYEGGWKAVVMLYADRMNESAQNAFLKTLEEPPRKTLLLLLTEDPKNIL